MNTPLLESWGFTTSNDTLNMLIGRKLGEGSFRKVYELVLNPDAVIKIEENSSFYNITEWEVWCACPKEYRKWLAPCCHISPCGTALIQRKVTPCRRRPPKIPDWLDDNKLSNWGRYKGRLVCCDYGHHRFFKNGFRRTKLVDGQNMWQTPEKNI